MHPTTVSQFFALIAVVTLSVAIAINIYRLISRNRKRSARRATPLRVPTGQSATIHTLDPGASRTRETPRISVVAGGIPEV